MGVGPGLLSHPSASPDTVPDTHIDWLTGALID